MPNRLKKLFIAVTQWIQAHQWKDEFPEKPGLYWLTYKTTSGWTKPILVDIKWEFEMFMISSGEKLWGVNGSQALFNQAVTHSYSRASWDLRALQSRWQKFYRPALPTE